MGTRSAEVLYGDMDKTYPIINPSEMKLRDKTMKLSEKTLTLLKNFLTSINQFFSNKVVH